MWLLVGIAALWCLWWWLAATAVERGATAWLDARRAEGWRAELQELAVTGFPLRLTARAEGIALADPSRGLGVEAEALMLSAPAYWPGDLTLSLPETPIRLDLPLGPFLLRASDAAGALRLHPGTALELEALSLQSGAWELNLPQGNLLSAEALALRLAQLPDAPARYRATLSAQGAMPGDLARGALALPPDWPRAVDRLEGDVTLHLAAPLDRRTLERRLPRPEAIALDGLALAWGPVGFSAEGAVEIDESGMPEGDLRLVVENWPEATARAEAAGWITEARRGQAEVLLNALANMGGGAETLDLTLRFAEGEMFLGPILLGPAPRLVIR